MSHWADGCDRFVVLGKGELSLYAHRHYLERHGTPANLAALVDHTLIGFDCENAFVRSVAAQLPFLKREFFAMRTGSDLAHLAGLRAGFGIGICQIGLARGNANLVRLFPRKVSLQLDTWLAMHEDLRHTPCCQVTFTALSEGLLRYIGAA